MDRKLQKARDFAGADWESLSKESRKKLLLAHRISRDVSDLEWKQLPPSFKVALARTLLKKD